MHFTVTRSALFGLAAVVLTVIGCTCKKATATPKQPLMSDGSSSDPAWRAQINRYGVYPPGSFPPVPPENLIGAATLQERNDICEAVIRSVTTKPPALLGETKYQFFGIEGESPKKYDLSPDLVRRLRRSKVPVQPVSAARWGRYEGEAEIMGESEHSEHGVMYFIVWIRKDSPSQAHVTVHAWTGFMHGAIALSCRLSLENGVWVTTKIVPVGALGVLGSVEMQDVD